MGRKCSTCGRSYKNKHAFAGHMTKCKPEEFAQNAAIQAEASSSAQDGSGLFGFHIAKQPRTKRGAVKKHKTDREPEDELDVLEALVLLQEQPGKDTSSGDKPGTDNPGDESATDNPGVYNSSAMLKDNQNLDRSSEQVMEYGAVIALKSERNLASVDQYGGTGKCGNEATVVDEEVKLNRNDDRQGVADCPEIAAVMELKRPKLDLKVPDNSVVIQEKKQNIDLSAPAPTDSSDEERTNVIDGQTDKTASATSLRKGGYEIPVAVKEDVQLNASDHHLSLMQEQNQKLDLSNPDMNYPVVMQPVKNSPSVDLYGGVEKSGNEAPVVQKEEVELSCNDDCQGVTSCPEKFFCDGTEKAQLDLNDPPFMQEQNGEPDLKVPENSFVMQQKNQKTDPSAPVPTNNSDEEMPNVIDGQTKQTTAATFLKKGGMRSLLR